MIAYYLGLALHSLRRTPVLSTLIVIAIAFGIGASMTTAALLRGMASDPIPWKSERLFAVQIDNAGPSGFYRGDPPMHVTWRDARALLEARESPRQAAMFRVSVRMGNVSGETEPFIASGRATTADFFGLFDVPFVAGRGWTAEEETSLARVVVLSEDLAARLFPRGAAVGRTVEMDDKVFTVIGVAAHWDPKPRFYDTGGSRKGGGFGSQDLYFLPAQTAVDQRIVTRGSTNCLRMPLPGYESFLASECSWLNFWVELPTAADVSRYHRFLENYSNEQRRAGRFDWDPNVRLSNVTEWLRDREVVPNEMRVATYTAFGFLFVCLLNASGLMLARADRGRGDLTLRRALGASRIELLKQGLVEAGVLGATGGIIGFGLVLLGLAAERSLLPAELDSITRVGLPALSSTLALSVLVTLFAGAYPAWRACRQTAIARAGSGANRTGAALIAVQIALTLAIVSNGLLFAREHLARMHRPSGVVESNLLAVSSRASVEGEAVRSRVKEDLAALRALPGVVDAYATSSLPLGGSGSEVYVDRRPLDDDHLRGLTRAAEYQVDEHALRTLGLRLVAGRWFDAGDIRETGVPGESPVIIVSRTLAERLFPGADATGQVVYKRGAFPSTIVGVVERLQTPWPNPGSSSTIVENSILSPWRYFDANVLFVVRHEAAKQGPMLEAVERELRRLDPRRVITDARTFEEVRHEAYRGSRALASMLGAVSALLLMVTALGVIGLTTYWSVQRRHQIGVRRALGARRADILRRFQTENLLIAGGGLVAGGLIASALNLALVKSIELSRMSTLELLVGAACVLLLTQLAALWPAFRAASIPPALATRTG